MRAAALLSHRSDLIFRIWGDGPERARLEQLAAQLGVASRVQFMGATEEPERALAQMHVFAYPTTGVHSPAKLYPNCTRMRVLARCSRGSARRSCGCVGLAMRMCGVRMCTCVHEYRGVCARTHMCTRVGLDISVYRVCAQAYLSVYPAGGGLLNLMGYVLCVASFLFPHCRHPSLHSLHPIPVYLAP